MPSMISTPVASRNASHTAWAGARRPTPPSPIDGMVLPAASIALYAVGAVRIRPPCSSIRSASPTASPSRRRQVEARRAGGTAATPPSPKVNAYGGVPVNTSSADGLQHAPGGVPRGSDITSRWKCIVAFGRPVVPEVNASMRDVVAEGPHVVERRVLGRQPLDQASSPKATIGTPSGSTASRKRSSTRAASRWAISWMVCRPPVRSSGMVVTRTSAGLQHAEPRRGQPLVVGTAQEHPVAGTMPRSSTRTWRSGSRPRSARRTTTSARPARAGTAGPHRGGQRCRPAGRSHS